jgi:hypothetical protein
MLVTAIAIAIALPLCAAESNPGKRERELIVEILQLTSGGSTMKSVVDAILAQSEKQFIAQAEARGDAPGDLEERKELYALLHEEIAGIDLSAALAEDAIRIYAKYYSERELADLVAFYRTPTGRKSIEVLPDIVRESAEASAQSVGPLLQEAASRAVHRQQEKRMPWRRTMSDMRSVATAIEAYAVDRDDMTYPRGDYESLRGELVPVYMKAVPAKDVWGTPYGYAVSGDGQHYRIVSAGADLKFEPASLRVVAAAGKRPVEVSVKDPVADIIYEDGMFMQYPAKP